MTAAYAQMGGMASRGLKPRPKGKPSGLPFHARFTDVAHQAGLRTPVLCGGLETADYIIETMSCGLAFLDYDNDGWLDIFLLSGSKVDGPPKDAVNRLYRNNRDGTFADVTEKAGLARSGFAYGVTVGDYNNDGFEDIFVTYWGQNVLYRNNGDGTFTDVTKEAGLLQSSPRWSTGCTFLDYDRNGRLDLFVSRYLVFDLKTVPRAGVNPDCNFKGVPINCGPRGLAPERHSLYHNNGDGTFTEVSAAAGFEKVNVGYGLTAVAADYDNDGWPDIYVACDTSSSQLFHNRGDGTFVEEGLERGVALSDDGQEQSGMGVAVGDYNLDGNLDIFKTHFSEDTQVLYSNQGKGDFEDVTVRAGLNETRFVTWGTGMVDLDNDGLPDLFVVSGSVYPEVEKRLPEYPHRMPRFLYRNLGGGKFEEFIEEAGPGVSALHASRGCAFGDFDNDGDLDILILNQNEPPSLLRNDASGDNHWLKVKLVGVTSNRSGIGARVTARYGGRVQAQEVLGQTSYLSVNDRRLHFGLGLAETANLEIRWPSGAREALTAVAADQLVTVTEGKGITRSEKFPQR
jgi:enediyne biosynthesis protein E4